MESITKQTEDYINLDDELNYVDVFYQEWESSMKAAETSTDLNGDELKEVLNDMRAKFEFSVAELLSSRLAISIPAIESDVADLTNIDEIIREVYTYFILGANDNFRRAIIADISSKHKTVKDSEENIIKLVQSMLGAYSPIVREMSPQDFLKYTKAENIITMYDEGKISGNFLRKYSCKLYQNEAYEANLVVDIVNAILIKEELINGKQ